MEIKTKAYGIVNINEENIIKFENGIIGFEDNSNYVLLGQDGNETFMWLQSLDDENLAFVVIQPSIFRPNYQPNINIDDLEGLDVEDEKDLVLYTIVVVPEDVKKMTTNLRAPIIINLNNNKARQVVLQDDRYQIKEALLA